jgi:hypothetical protein
MESPEKKRKIIPEPELTLLQLLTNVLYHVPEVIVRIIYDYVPSYRGEEFIGSYHQMSFYIEISVTEKEIYVLYKDTIVILDKKNPIMMLKSINIPVTAKNIVVHNNEIFVSSINNSIYSFNRNDNDIIYKSNFFGLGVDMDPPKLLINGNNLFAADQYNCVKIFNTIDLKPVSQFDYKDYKCEVFLDKQNIIYDWHDDIFYVSNSRDILIFDNKFCLKEIFNIVSIIGDMIEQSNTISIAVTDKEIFAVSPDENSIVVFDKYTRTFIRKFGDDVLKKPRHITIFNDDIFVLDSTVYFHRWKRIM